MKQYAIQLLGQQGTDYPPAIYIMADSHRRTGDSIAGYKFCLYRESYGDSPIAEFPVVTVAGWWIEI